PPRSLLRAGGYEATQTLASRDLLSLCWPLEPYSLPKERSHIYLNLYIRTGLVIRREGRDVVKPEISF
ncbi:MAG TPA: hypothetical protein QF870_12125, partial [Nitrospinota bacterium]|nr:hypothetical protein [Nitrospinota bacterium]